MVSSAINFKIFVTGLGNIEKPSIPLLETLKVALYADIENGSSWFPPDSQTLIYIVEPAVNPVRFRSENKFPAAPSSSQSIDVNAPQVPENASITESNPVFPVAASTPVSIVMFPSAGTRTEYQTPGPLLPQSFDSEPKVALVTVPSMR